MATLQPLVLATGNRHKLTEFAALLARTRYCLSGAPVGFAVDEDGATFADNAAKKAYALRALLLSATAGQLTPGVLADDSGLVVPALHGDPGVRSARYAPPAADQDAANRDHLLTCMQGLAGPARSAYFVCALACIDAAGHLITAHGEVHGHIAERETGRGGFGYDSVFVPAGHTRTFAASPPELKAAMSHRAHAVSHLLHQLPAI